MMRNTILISTFVILMTSCKDKLPENIKNAVNNVNAKIEILDEIGFRIERLDSAKIENMPLDTIQSILHIYEIANNDAMEARSKLKELLKYNAKFSDYEEVKNVKEYSFNGPNSPFYKNDRYLLNMKFYLQRKELAPEAQKVLSESLKFEHPKYND